ncbi:hypothetical protein LS684_21805 (plasmid) [Cytobacillus spongiae]|uniref:hypothetical protein n=1 Tax=Cytobacillus spongiae TaxID=2901381 RepID=UPI001F3D5AAE|nr:hypothetical protein [Cytobacillus spongiae]UII58251.1 hypothetical protein LS684_21805 [Cytobacillus spongiae]
MSLENIVTMLKTLKEFKDSEIVHTISTQDHSPIMTVTYQSDTECFQITYVESRKVEKYTNLSQLAATIESIIHLEPSR